MERSDDIRNRASAQLAVGIAPGNGHGGGHGGGGEFGTIDLMLDPVAPVQGEQPGVAARIEGTYVDIDAIDFYGVTAECDGQSVDASCSAGRWSGEIRFYHAGTFTVRATASGRVGNSLGQRRDVTVWDSGSVTVTLVSSIPDLTIEAPSANVPVPLSRGGGHVKVDLVTSDAFGPRSLSIDVDGRGESPWHAGDSVALEALPYGQRVLTARCRDPAGNENVQTVTVIGTDATPPDLTVVAPEPDQRIVSTDGSTATATFRGRAIDVQGEVSAVSWALSTAGPWTQATTSNAWRDWEADVLLPRLDIFTVWVRAVDVVGNVASASRRVQSVSSYVPATLDDRLDEHAYLAALLQFADEEVQVAAGPPPEPASAAVLSEIFAQPFASLSQPTADALAIGAHAVNELRVPIEVLRRFPEDLTLMGARWTFEPETVNAGSIADVTGHGNTALLVGNATASGSGHAGGHALSVPDDSSGMRVASSSSLDIGAHNGDFSLAFWLQPTAGVADHWRVLLHKGGAAFAGVVGLWVSNQEMKLYGMGGLEWSTRSLVMGQWIHVAYVRQGVELRLYLDGHLDSSAAHPTELIIPNSFPLCVGHDGWSPAMPAVFDDLRVYRFALSAESIRTLVFASQEPASEELATAGDESTYCAAAYEALLGAVGTSYAELRLARGASTTERAALAERLGTGLSANRPDELDQLTLAADGQTENALESLFGLENTDPALAVPRTLPTPALLSWRLAATRLRWAAQDHDPQAPQRGFPVLLDPDVVSSSDIEADTAGDAARALLRERAAALTCYAAQLARLRSGATPSAADFAAVMTEGLPNVDLDALAGRRAGAASIDGELEAAGLSQSSFLVLLRLKRLAEVGSLTAAEWQDVDDILVGVEKGRRIAAWRQQETAITLSPETFVLNGGAPHASQWRASSTARSDWLAVLRARANELSELHDGHASALADVERAVLPLLRDLLIGRLCDDLTAGDVGEWLTERYQIDMRKSGARQTTRVRQAVDTLQSTLYSIRTTRLPAWSPAGAWTIPDARVQEFDAAWKWMAEYPAWRASMLTFLQPERNVDPILVEQPSAAFRRLADALAQDSGLSPSSLRAYLSDYVNGTAPVHGDDGIPGVAGHDGIPGTFSYEVTHYQLHDESRALLNGTRDPGGPVWQAYYGAPLLVARALSAAGQYEAALSWYRRVYDYAALAGEREVYAGLQLEHNVAPDLSWAPARYLDFNPHALANGRPNPYTRYVLVAIASCFVEYADAQFIRGTQQSRTRARSLYVAAVSLLEEPALQPVAPSTPGEGAYENPDALTLRATAQAQLAKLRSGLSIAGLPEPRIDAPQAAAPLLHPGRYRYRVLLERARQLAGQATQIEAAYLSSLEKFDDRNLRRFDAEQALDLVDMQTTLQDKRLTEAQHSKEVAIQQQTKATNMVTKYANQIGAGPNEFENKMLEGYKNVRNLRNALAGINAGIGVNQAMMSGVGSAVATGGVSMVFGVAGALLSEAQGVVTTVLDNAEEKLSANQLMAGVKQRQTEWGLQRDAANEDAKIATKQMQVADDQIEIVEQERAIAVKQVEQARARLNFLDGQFTSRELYGWMSDLLAGVYRYFLRQASATARAAQDQLAFERAEAPRAFVQLDYWAPPTTAGAGRVAVDRRGLTGAERLSEDLARLDQYAFVTDRRRLNLTQTFSLADRMPSELGELRSSGTLSFATPMSWFDETFPGHYLRLIRQVRTSIVALIPPSQGIRASLRNSGLSRVMTPTNGRIAETIVYAAPEVVALTSPVNSNGLFEIDLQPDMLLPFEATGVDTSWQLDLPPQANPFDFSTIVDVLFTVEYTALEDLDYRTRIITQLNGERTRRTDRVFSLARDFPDAWYVLNNQTAGEPPVDLPIRAVDVPSMLQDVVAEHVAVQLVADVALAPVTLTLTRGTEGGTAQTIDGVAGSRRGNAPAWTRLCGRTPVGTWSLAVDHIAHRLLADGTISDILLVIGCAGQAPLWAG